MSEEIDNFENDRNIYLGSFHNNEITNKSNTPLKMHKLSKLSKISSNISTEIEYEDLYSNLANSNPAFHSKNNCYSDKKLKTIVNKNLVFNKSHSDNRVSNMNATKFQNLNNIDKEMDKDKNLENYNNLEIRCFDEKTSKNCVNCVNFINLNVINEKFEPLQKNLKTIQSEINKRVSSKLIMEENTNDFEDYFDSSDDEEFKNSNLKLKVDTKGDTKGDKFSNIEKEILKIKEFEETALQLKITYYLPLHFTNDLDTKLKLNKKSMSNVFASDLNLNVNYLSKHFSCDKLILNVQKTDKVSDLILLIIKKINLESKRSLRTDRIYTLRSTKKSEYPNFDMPCKLYLYKV